MALPYERRSNETDPAWQAFVVYRDAGLERSHEKVARALGKSTQLIGRWSRAHQWVKRVRAWDVEIDRRKRLEDLTAIEKMRRRQIDIATKMQTLGLSELEKLTTNAEALEKENAVPAELILKLIDQGAKLERLNRGEPSDIVQQQSASDLDPTQLTTEELRDLRRIRAAIAKRKLDAEQAAED